MNITFTSLSSSPSSFDANLCQSHNATTAGRFSSILRRFLCPGSLRTHPFDCVKEVDRVGAELDHYNDLKVEGKMEGSVTPGIVARLMGLETLPELNPLSTRASKGAIGRSRSVNSVDCLSKFDTTQTLHRRVMSTLSFRDIPSFVHEEDDEFLVLSFERRGEGERNIENRRDKPIQGKKIECQESNSNKCSKPQRKISDGPSQNGGNCHKTKQSSSNSSQNKKKHRQSHTCTKPRKPLKDRNKKEKQVHVGRRHYAAAEEVEIELSSENSSPISVLDLTEFVSEPSSPLSEEDSRLKVSKSRRKLSTDLVDYEGPSLMSSPITITKVVESKLINVQVTKSTKMDSESEDYFEVLGEVSKLAEIDMQTSSWITKDTSEIEDFEEIRTELGLQIIDCLLHEFITERLVLRI